MESHKLDDVIISPNTTIQYAIEAINKNGVRGVFVCDEDRELVGIVMDSDIRRAMLSNSDPLASVRTIMKTSPFAIDHGLPPAEKKRLFVKSDKLLVPLVDEGRRVVNYLGLPEVLGDIWSMQDGKDNGIMPPQKVLVIGGAGYIGSVLSHKLLRLGYDVRILDLLLYGKEPISNLTDNNLEFIRGDCRDQMTVIKALEGVEAVVHLGEIVGDPACGINENFTIETNYLSTQMIVESCVKQGIKRFVFASSCSVYGQSDDEVDEESELNPVSLYARCKMESEKAILSFDYDHFCPTIFRLATVHGKSYRQRVDLVVNLLSIKALAEGKIQIFGGDQWRPFISVEDVCRGIIAVLSSESSKVKNQVFNLGDSRENYQLVEIGNIIDELIVDTEVENLEDQTDKRNYRVSFEKIKRHLGFSAEHHVRDSVKDFISAYRNDMLFHDYKAQKYYNVLTLKEG
ncbi:NAD-dependent epimerase/dehydratase family protein, partial [bacterium]|nr:NAD-dependent epimerase/dehydratase family protein [bacterium]